MIKEKKLLVCKILIIANACDYNFFDYTVHLQSLLMKKILLYVHNNNIITYIYRCLLDVLCLCIFMHLQMVKLCLYSQQLWFTVLPIDNAHPCIIHAVMKILTTFWKEKIKEKRTENCYTKNAFGSSTSLYSQLLSGKLQTKLSPG